MEVTRQAKALYASSLELCNDLETIAGAEPGVSGAVLRDWLAGVPLQPGADSFLLPEHASLGQAVEECRRLSRRTAHLASLVLGAMGPPTGV